MVLHIRCRRMYLHTNNARIYFSFVYQLIFFVFTLNRVKPSPFCVRAYELVILKRLNVYAVLRKIVGFNYCFVL